MDCQPGDVCFFDFPNTEMDGWKDRTALLLKQISPNDFLACMVTSKKPTFDRYLSIDSDVLVEGSLSKLPSHVRVLRLATVHKQAIRRRTGRVSQEFLKQAVELLREELA